MEKDGWNYDDLDEDYFNRTIGYYTVENTNDKTCHDDDRSNNRQGDDV